MKRFSWCTARTEWLVQTGLRQREQSSLWRRSWRLIKAAQRGEAGAADQRGGVSALFPSAASIFTLLRHRHSAFFTFSQPSALLAGGVLWACPALCKGESSGLADNWKGEFELVALCGLFWEDFPAHHSCRSPLGWWAPADYQWTAPRKDYGIFSVLSRPIEDIDPNLSQFTVGRKNIKFMWLCLIAELILWWLISLPCAFLLRSHLIDFIFFFFFLSDADSVKEFSSVCSCQYLIQT